MITPARTKTPPPSARDPMPDTPDEHAALRDAVRSLCRQFPDEYFRKIDAERAYPEAFVAALTRAGWLAALIPQEYGGSGLGLTEASVIMEEINRSGGNAGACHGQMYNMGTLLRHGSERQKRDWLPRIASGELRLQSMAVTEPGAGTDTTRIATTAVRRGDRYVINGQKVWISRVQHHGGYGFASEYDVERKFRETRLYQVAPISTNLILAYVAEHVLGLPRSF